MKIIIEKVGNGYIVHGVADNGQPVVIEESVTLEHADIEAGQRLLWEIIEGLDLGGSKHDEVRLRATIAKKGEDHDIRNHHHRASCPVDHWPRRYERPPRGTRQVGRGESGAPATARRYVPTAGGELMGALYRTYDEAREAAFAELTAIPFGFIQWQGTSVCMDVHCICGALVHIDAAFTFAVQCGECGKCYLCRPFIELIEYETHRDGDPLEVAT
jgi:hypothetical protein